MLDSGIRGVASDDAPGNSKGGFAVKEDTGSGGAPPAGSSDSGGSGGAGSGGCTNVIAGGCGLGCAELRRLLSTRTQTSTGTPINVQPAEKGCR